MRKLLFLVALVLGGGWFLKANLPADDHTRSAGFSLPTLGFGQISGLMALVSSMATGHGQTQEGIARTATTPGVISVNGARSGVGSNAPGSLAVPPELMRFMTPSLLNTTPSGTGTLSPESQLALRQIIAQARANPAAFREQLNAVAKAVRGVQ